MAVASQEVQLREQVERKVRILERLALYYQETQDKLVNYEFTSKTN